MIIVVLLGSHNFSNKPSRLLPRWVCKVSRLYLFQDFTHFIKYHVDPATLYSKCDNTKTPQTQSNRDLRKKLPI